MDVTLRASPGRRVIDAYGDGGFRVNGSLHSGPILVLPDAVLPWAVTPPAETGRGAGSEGDGTPAMAAVITVDSLAPILARAADLDLLVVGCGARMTPLPPEVRAAVRAAGLGVESMDTGAACRTYSVLSAEDRRVAAALMAV